MERIVNRRELLPYPLSDGVRVSREFFESLDSDDDSILSDCPTLHEDDMELLYNEEISLRYSISSDEEIPKASPLHDLISEDEQEEGEMTSDSDQLNFGAPISDDDSASDISWK